MLALACDRIAEQKEPCDFAHVLVADLAARAIRDTEGARWSNVEHRVIPGDLESCIGWALGNAGIVRELLRFVRLRGGGDPRCTFAWPDQPPVPAQATIRNCGTNAVS
ncbi:hypothetical protein ACFTT0_04280 [Streptomyces bauhiniae]|uniref:hypothetical protein n=1 Tax=Streptomyces bauhiniae TaxID=2340725 RepID=UPI003637EC51